MELTAERIARIASELSCHPPEMAMNFARMIAEHCAQLAAEHSQDAAAYIRTEFRVDEARHREAAASAHRVFDDAG